MSVEAEQRYQVNEVEVAAKVIGGEAVMINLVNGTYYAMDGVGAGVWELLSLHFNTGEIAAELNRRYGVEIGPVASELSALVEELQKEKLLLPADQAPAGAPGDAPVEFPKKYAAPKLNTYRDMGDMLALDPPMPGLGEIPWDGKPKG